MSVYRRLVKSHRNVLLVQIRSPKYSNKHSNDVHHIPNADIVCVCVRVLTVHHGVQRHSSRNSPILQNDFTQVQRSIKTRPNSNRFSFTPAYATHIHMIQFAAVADVNARDTLCAVAPLCWFQLTVSVREPFPRYQLYFAYANSYFIDYGDWRFIL